MSKSLKDIFIVKNDRGQFQQNIGSNKYTGVILYINNHINKFEISFYNGENKLIFFFLKQIITI